MHRNVAVDRHLVSKGVGYAKLRVHLSLVRAFSSTEGAVIHLPKANVYRFGDSNSARPVFRDLEWTVKEDEAWAVVGSGSGEKTALFQMLLGHLRISPSPSNGLFPFLSALPKDPLEGISIVSFGNRRRAAEGSFYDYTARYGAVREEDKITLRQSMFPETIPAEFGLGPTNEESKPERLLEYQQKIFDDLIDKLGLKSLIDLPLIALSNGQTRRARIIKAILSKPELLLLDEPLTGLDVQSRPTLLKVLHDLHTDRNPRIILGMRTQDPVPDWITHLAFVKEGKVLTGPKDKILSAIGDHHMNSSISVPKGAAPISEGKILVDMKDVNVKYGPRTVFRLSATLFLDAELFLEVLKNIHWQIRQGERWHLQGTNGSGKTTLLSLLTGDHPQSYTQPHLHLHALPRRRIPTAHLHALVGLVSPELFDAFPRRADMSVWDAVGTGFDGGFVPLGREGVGLGVLRPLEPHEVRWRVERCWKVLSALGPHAWGADAADEAKGKSDSEGQGGARGGGSGLEAFKNRAFVDLSAGEQRMVLLMRALVGRPPLVLLDEVWSGMDDRMIGAARRYLRAGAFGADQAVVVITHWEDEVPWGEEDGIRRFRLQDGEGRVGI